MGWGVGGGRGGAVRRDGERGAVAGGSAEMGGRGGAENGAPTATRDRDTATATQTQRTVLAPRDRAHGAAVRLARGDEHELEVRGPGLDRLGRRHRPQPDPAVAAAGGEQARLAVGPHRREGRGVHARVLRGRVGHRVVAGRRGRGDGLAAARRHEQADLLVEPARQQHGAGVAAPQRRHAPAQLRPRVERGQGLEPARGGAVHRHEVLDAGVERPAPAARRDHVGLPREVEHGPGRRHELVLHVAGCEIEGVGELGVGGSAVCAGVAWSSSCYGRGWSLPSHVAAHVAARALELVLAPSRESANKGATHSRWL